MEGWKINCPLAEGGGAALLGWGGGRRHGDVENLMTLNIFRAKMPLCTYTYVVTSIQRFLNLTIINKSDLFMLPSYSKL